MSASPHDAFFKAMFRVPQTAAEHLRQVLPAELAESLALDALEHRPGSFVDDALADRHADLVFEAPFRGQEGRAVFYVLFEHQSSNDPLMPFRLLRYATRLWEDVVAREPARRRLPPVIPVVLFHGAGGWRGPTSMRGLYEGPQDALEAMGRSLPALELVLTDLSSVDASELQEATLSAVAKLFLKHARDEDLWQKLPGWTELLRAVAAKESRGLRGLRLVVEYLLRIQDVPVQDLTQLLSEVHPTVPELVQTTADRLHAQGEAVGEARGRLRGRAEAVVQVLESRGVDLGDADRARILASRDEAELDRWLRQAVVIAAVTDLFVAND